MDKLTYKEIELLQYIVRVYTNEMGDPSLEIESLKNKLIKIRTQLEYESKNEHKG